MLAQSKNKAILEGPVCNGSQVSGWHTNEKIQRLRRFHVDMSGFAFNSTILWDPKRWRRPTSQPIRQLDTVKEGFQVRLVYFQYLWFAQCLIIFVVASNIISVMQIIKLCFLIQCIEMKWYPQETTLTFIEQVVEDEGQMEGTPAGCAKIMKRHLHLEAQKTFYPKGWLLQKNLVAALPLKWLNTLEFWPLCSREVCSCCYEIYLEHYTLSYLLKYWVEHLRWS